MVVAAAAAAVTTATTKPLEMPVCLDLQDEMSWESSRRPLGGGEQAHEEVNQPCCVCLALPLTS